jgi:hypothetical protein
MEKDIMIIIERIGKVNDRVMEQAELVVSKPNFVSGCAASWIGAGDC